MRDYGFGVVWVGQGGTRAYGALMQDGWDQRGMRVDGSWTGVWTRWCSQPWSRSMGDADDPLPHRQGDTKA